MNDLKFAFRQLLKNPGFTAVAVLTLALGIGANTAIFGFVDAVLLRPPPYPDPDRLVRITSVNPSLGVTDSRSSNLNVADWRDRGAEVADIAAFQEWDGAVTVAGKSERVRVNWVTPNLLPMLGIKPLHGRLLEDGEKVSRILLPHGLWQRMFDGDVDAIGRGIKIDGHDTTVVGILPPSVKVPAQGTAPVDQAFLAADLRHTDLPRDLQLLNVVARLKPGVTPAQAQEEMNRIAAELEKEFPDTNRGWGAKVADLKAWQTQNVRPQLIALYGATAILLLIACLNVSNLLLMRGESRRKEFAIRGALGSTRLRLVRQTLGESLMLSFIGGGAGLLLAVSCHGFLTRTAPAALGIPHGSGVDPKVIFSALAATVIAALLSGMFPALRLGEGNLNSALVEAGRSTSPGRNRRRLLGGLVVGQIAISAALLAAAGFTFVSLRNLLRVDPGFARDHTLSFRVDPYPNPELTQRLIADMEALPGVRFVGASNIELLNDVFSNGVRISAGDGGEEASAAQTVDYWRVTTDYLSAAGIPLIAGRCFTSRDPYDTFGGTNVIINEALAKRFFPGRDPVGKKINLLGNHPREIVGVVGSIKHRGLQGDDIPILFVHAKDAPVFVVRSLIKPALLVPVIRSALQDVNPEMIMSRVSTTEEIVERSLADRRFGTRLIFAMAILGMALAAVGLYGVMSYAVGCRTREIGIRMAVGAQRLDVTRMIVRHGLFIATSGTILGLVTAAALGWTLKSMLFGVSPVEPSILAAVAVLLVFVALLACWFPARRAAKVDPMQALRAE